MRHLRRLHADRARRVPNRFCAHPSRHGGGLFWLNGRWLRGCPFGPGHWCLCLVPRPFSASSLLWRGRGWRLPTWPPRRDGRAGSRRVVRATAVPPRLRHAEDGGSLGHLRREGRRAGGACAHLVLHHGGDLRHAHVQLLSNALYVVILRRQRVGDELNERTIVWRRLRRCSRKRVDVTGVKFTNDLGARISSRIGGEPRRKLLCHFSLFS